MRSERPVSSGPSVLGPALVVAFGRGAAGGGAGTGVAADVPGVSDVGGADAFGTSGCGGGGGLGDEGFGDEPSRTVNIFRTSEMPGESATRWPTATRSASVATVPRRIATPFGSTVRSSVPSCPCDA